MSKPRIIIGIDTGGTYTDAAVIDATQHRILASAKAITTKGDLAVGVGEAMAAAAAKLGGEVKLSDVGLVCVSTTLATNAVVEGHGTPAGVILIGFDAGMMAKTGIAKAFPGMPIITVAGGHDHNGDERAKLDIEAIKAFVAAHDDGVSAYAVAGSFAVRNAAHERQARDVIAVLSEKPVTVSNELSSALDAPRRALTATLNARLVSRVTHLIEAVERAMVRLGIKATLMVVKGDGSLALADSVAKRPIETVLSGPAASLIGARWLSQLDDFIMSDMGGTTTDVGVLLKGRPQVAEQGAEVGGWRTMVKAIDVKTVGLGGDSEVQFDVEGRLVVGPQRAVPIALLAARYPETVAMLEGDLAESEGGSQLGKFLVRPFAGGKGIPSGLSEREAEVMAGLGERPVALRRLATSSAAQRAIASLRRKGLLQFSCFTPSDAACALGLQDNWSPVAARLAAKLSVRFREMKLPDDQRTDDFCREVWGKTVELSVRVILETAMGPADKASAAWSAVAEGRGQLGLARISLAPMVPLVAVGGPVKVYYTEVARRLGCEVVYAPFCDVANAVGAAAGEVADRVTVSVEGDGNGLFRVYGAGQTLSFSSGAIALEQAEKLARDAAVELAKSRGAGLPKVSIEVTKMLLPEAKDDEGLLTAKIEAEAIGVPV